ncbi:MAG: GNAT family N-acetyltransferase [Pseudoxanthomonas sp.]
MDEHLIASDADTSEAHHVERLRYHFDCAQILMDRDRPVGLLKVKRGTAEWEIIQIQLSPQLQGKGAGRAILQGVIDEATSAGARLRLSVLKANPAKRLYEKLGFVAVGETAHEYIMVRAV